jgi:uncharacterized protein YfaS (alpha-2-macroglobulin family)
MKNNFAKRISAVFRAAFGIVPRVFGRLRIVYTPPSWLRKEIKTVAKGEAPLGTGAPAAAGASSEAALPEGPRDGAVGTGAPAAAGASGEIALPEGPRDGAPAAAGASGETALPEKPLEVAPSRASLSFARALKPFFDLSGKRSFLTYGGLALLGLLALVAALLLRSSNALEVSVEPPSPDPKGGDSRSPLYVDFSGSAAKIELVGKELPAGARLDPPLPGTWLWAEDSKLAFMPSKPWPIGASYTVSLDPSLFSDQVKLRRRSLSFQTAAFVARLSAWQFYIDPLHPANKRVTARVTFTHLPLRNQLDKMVDMGSPFTVSWDPDGLSAYLVSAAVAVPDKAYEVKIRLRGSITAQAGSPACVVDQQATVTVPGRYDNGRIEEVGTAVVREPSFEYRKILAVDLSLGVAPDELAKRLSVFLLPKDRPEAPGTPKDENHEWRESEIDAAVLSASQKLELSPLPIEGDYGTKVQFAYEAPSGRRLYVRQLGDLELIGGYRSRQTFSTFIQVPSIPKEVRIMHEGSVLSMTGEKKIALFANDMDDVIFEIGRIIPDQVNHFVSQTEGDFRNPEFEGWDFGLENLSSIYHENLHLNRLEAGKPQYFSFDFDKYLGRESDPRMKYGLFSFKVSEYDAAEKKPGAATSRRFILVTDLGLLVKKGEGSGYEVFVQSVRSGRPVAGASVEVIGKNGLTLLAVKTDAGGHASLPSLAGFEREKSPVVFVVKKEGDMSFLPVRGRGRFLNYSRFDTGGVYGSADPGFVDAFLFSDRGIYRPGEELHLGLIVKAGSWKRGLSGLPLELAIEDPRGLEVMRRKFSLPASGFEEASWRSLESSPTGKYEAKLYIARDKEEKKLIGSTSVKIEEFRPDRLSIRSRFIGDQGLAWMPLENLKTEVLLMNLYGTPAAGNKVRAKAILSPAILRIAGYADYHFFDPYLAEKTVEEELGEATTDTGGKASFDVDLSRFDRATFLLRVQSEGIEKEGGRGVAAESAVIVSPLGSILGWKADGDLGYINKGAARRLSFVAIDPREKAVALEGLSLQIYETRYVSILEKGADELYHYRSVEKKLRLLTRPLSIGSSGLDFALPTTTPGDFVLEIEDGAGTKLASVGYSVIGAANLARSLDKNAELQVKLDRPDYAPGDTIKVNIKAPYVGSGLITIERDRVYAYSWFKADTSASVQTITVPADLEGSAYINVSFVRDIGSHDIYSSPLSYGVVPFSISRERKTNRISLDLPTEAKGGTRLRVGYSTSKPGRMVLFAVDEGILQVAKYQTPRPLDHFLRKRALEVESSQILDLILPEYSIIKAVSAMGGDSDGPASNLNPFKRKNKPPLAVWSGLLVCGPETRSYEFDLPSYYNGTVRVMAVAVADDSIGSVEARTVVRNDFVIVPSLPPVLAPGDEFEVGVSVMNDQKGVEGKTEVALSLEADADRLELLGSPEAGASLAHGEEATFFFRFRVRKTLGEARIDFTAKGGKASSTLWETMSIRPELPYRVELSSGRIVSGAKELALTRRLIPEFRKLEVRASYLPLGLAGGLKDYLDSYPYGCTEQILSRSFPFLALAALPDFGVDSKTALDSFLAAQAVLRSRQNSGGGIGLWSAGDGASFFATAYGAHYLTEAREAGMPVDANLLGSALGWLKSSLESLDSAPGFDANAAAYAVYVLTRNGVVTTRYINGLLGSAHLPPKWRSGPVAAYLSGAYALMKQNDEAASLLDSAFGWIGREDEPFYSLLALRGLCLFMASRHIPTRVGPVAAKALEEMSAAIGDSKYNTLSSAYAILGLAAYSQAAGLSSRESLHVAAKTAGGAFAGLGLKPGLSSKAELAAGTIAVKFEDLSGKPLYYQLVQAGFETEPPAKPEKRGIEVFHEYTDAAGLPLQVVELGSQVFVHVKIRTIDPKRKEVKDVAIVDLLPSGFELAGELGGDGRGSTGNLAPHFVEPREDRVLIFCDVGSEVRDFVYPVKATAGGSFVLPPAFAEAMYDLSVWSMQSEGGHIVVADKKR